jgi:protein-disulfide isomerase/uncharacterized membrane protein
MEKIISEFLHSIKVPVSKNYVEKLILSHPNYPSLLSIGDTLERLGIPYHARRIKREQLGTVSLPYLLPLSGGDILFIKNENDLKKNKESLHRWSEVLLQVEATDKVTDGESNARYSEDKNLYRISAITTSILAVLLLLPLINTFTWANLVLLFTSIIGILVGYLLVAKDLGVKYDAIESFCNAGQNANCDKILNSDDSKIVGLFKFSDAVLTYFTAQSILLSVALYLPNESLSIIYTLSALSLLTIPLIFFSIYYQSIKAKTWCKLCLVVDALLTIQLFTFGYLVNSNNYQFNSISFIPPLLAILLFITLGVSLLLVKSLIERINKAELASAKGSRLKNSISVFSYLLTQQRKVDAAPFNQEFVIGNPDAPVKILMVSNLFCKPCKEQHEKVAQLLANYPDKVNLTVRFLLSGTDSKNALTTNQWIIQYWRENIYNRDKQSENTEKLIHDWFAEMNFDKFKKKYALQGSIDQQTIELEAQQVNWVSDASITGTPTFFVNGFELPKEYSPEDLAPLVPSLTDIITKNKAQAKKLQSIST